MFCVVAIKGLCKRGAEGCASQCAHIGNFCTEVRRAHSPRGKRRARGALIRDIAIEDGRDLGNGALAEPAVDRVKEDTPAERLLAFLDLGAEAIFEETKGIAVGNEMPGAVDRETAIGRAQV